MPIDIKPFIREVNPDDIKKKIEEVKLISRTGDGDDLNPVRRIHKYMCAMQLVTYITGREQRNEDGSIADIDYYPICVSEEIRNLAIEINDGTSAAALQKFLDVDFLLRLMGTAPIGEKIVRRKRPTKDDPNRVVTNVTQVAIVGDPRYREAEHTRRKMITDRKDVEAKARNKRLYDSDYDWATDSRVPITAKMKFLVELADVARFDAPELLPCAIINGKIQKKSTETPKEA